MAIMKHRSGFTLIEILVVVAIFSVLAIVTAQAVVQVIGSTSRSTSSAKLRENLEYGIAIAERSLRNATNITSCTGNTSVTYLTSESVEETLRCSTTGGNTTLMKGNESLTSESINLTTCRISCSSVEGDATLNKVEVSLEGVDTTSSYDAPSLQLQTQIILRSY